MNEATFNRPPHALVSENFWRKFEENEPQGETLQMKGKALLEAVLESNRISRGATDTGQLQDEVDHEALEVLKNADSDDPQHAHAMLALKRLAVNPTNAVEYIDRVIMSRETKMSQNMSAIATNQRPKGRKPFADIIDAIVEKDSCISRNSLLQRLKKHEDLSIKNDEIVYNPTCDVMTVDALRGALSRSKKRISKNSKKHSR